MKYRVIQVYDTPIDIWFRLQESEDGEQWKTITSGSDQVGLARTMRRLAENMPPVVVAEAGS